MYTLRINYYQNESNTKKKTVFNGIDQTDESVNMKTLKYSIEIFVKKENNIILPQISISHSSLAAKLL